MALHTHRADRADVLVRALADELAGTISGQGAHRSRDPFTREVVAVPTRGIERWLRQQLSHRLGASPGGTAGSTDGDGVCANVDMPSPGTLFAELLAQIDGVRAEDDPWRPASLRWRILQVLDAAGGQPWAAPLWHHLTTGAPGSRQVAVATRLASLLTDYATTRPQMVRDWAEGGNCDGAGVELPSRHGWQPELLRRLRELLGPGDPASRVAAATAVLADEPDAVDLPERLSLFGPTRLATTDLELLRVLAIGRDVHLWLPHPSPSLWDRLSRRDDRLQTRRAPRRREDRSPVEVRNPLLRSLGRDARELQLRLAVEAGPTLDAEHPSPPAPRRTLLQQVQTTLRQDDPPPVHPAPVEAGDRSLQVHACYGRARQVEVLREVITRLLADDRTLQPRDIIVMCPDVEAFAALVLAAFGSAPADPATPDSAPGQQGRPGHPGQRLRVRLADRSLRQTNPVLDVVSRLLDLSDGRVSSSDVLDLARLPPVAARFRFDDDDLDRARELLLQSNIRWGLTAADRAGFGLDQISDNTWHHGLDRWLLGVTMTSAARDPAFIGAPLDDIESTEIELVGRFVELVHRVAAARRGLQGQQRLPAWTAALTAALDAITSTDDSSSWQRVQADRLLAEQVAAAGPDGPVLGIGDVREILADLLQGRPTRTSFRTGDLTVCSMVPMRSVPHRVVVLLGADELDLPRTPVVDGDNVLALDPLVGERDIASEDRQQVLDAVFAATDRLIVLYSGADERTGARLPPAVPLGELLDDLTRRFVGPKGEPALDLVVHRHPLQPFDPRNFIVAAPVPSFDRAALAGARALVGERSKEPPFFDLVLPVPVEEVIDLDDLVQFFAHPVRHFVRHRLGLSLRDFADDLQNELDLSLDGLQKWAIGDRMLHARLAGRSRAQVVEAALRAGGLPPVQLGRRIGRPIAEAVDALVTAAGPGLAAPADSVDIRLTLPDGRQVAGAVSGVRDGVLTRVQYSSLKARHRLEDWVKLLALRSVASVEEVSARLVGGTRAQSVLFTAPEPGVARRLLADLVGCYDAGRAEPLPLPPTTAEEYARARLRGSRESDRVIWKAYESGSFAEGLDPEYALLIGSTTADLLAVRQRAEGRWPTTAHDERTWFASLARAVFDPLITHSRQL